MRGHKARENGEGKGEPGLTHPDNRTALLALLLALLRLALVRTDNGDTGQLFCHSTQPNAMRTGRNRRRKVRRYEKMKYLSFSFGFWLLDHGNWGNGA